MISIPKSQPSTTIASEESPMINTFDVQVSWKRTMVFLCRLWVDISDIEMNSLMIEHDVRYYM